MGIGTRTRPIPPNTDTPTPQPNLLTRGSVAKGRTVLMRQRVTIIAVMPEAAYRPKASTTYAFRGRYTSINAVPTRPTANRRTGKGSLSADDADGQPELGRADTLVLVTQFDVDLVEQDVEKQQTYGRAKAYNTG
ncbi:hypothetical protein NPX13_g9203 [Xylaria arbuscula]|uniref:Uncharacterized protein n=1 Tax=Xylaria arbuscula TaxID=114810 RepID=A0A9W8N744_9PEZI|nr:hypothetical protein NPX13_g9203 [Xylaria arbuscula]